MDVPPLELSLNDVSVAIGDLTICSEVSLSVRPGAIVGIVGPNGSGKTTLLRSVYRMLRPRLGNVVVGGDDVWDLRPREAARRIAVVVQEPRSDFEFTVGEVVAMGRSPHQSMFARESEDDRRKVRAALEHVGLAGFSRRLYNTLSGGEKQRVMIARAMVQEARVLILDEPTNHLDIRYQLEVLELVREVGVTTLMSIHDVNLAAAYCEQVAVMCDGRLVAAGETEAVLTPAILEPVLNVGIEVIPRNGSRPLLWFHRRR